MAWPTYDALNRATSETRTLIHPVTGEQEILTRTRSSSTAKATRPSETDALGRDEHLDLRRSGPRDRAHPRATAYASRACSTTTPATWKRPSCRTTRAVDELVPAGDQVRTSTYDAGDRRVSQTDAEGHTTFMEYDRADRVIRRIDPRGTVTEHDYDGLDWLVQTRLKLQRGRDEAQWAVTDFAYDKVGNRIGETRAGGNVITHTYDGLNRKTATVDTLGSVGTWSYDARGNVLTESDGEGHTTVHVYDALDRPVQEIRPEEREILRLYDAAGNLVSETDARGHTMTSSYDTLNRRVQTTDPAPFLFTTLTTYDVVGNVVAETDRRGHTTDFEFDALNRLTRRTDPEVDGTRLTQSYTYDAADNRLSMTDARGIVTTHTYDRENRLTQTRRAELVLETTQYDPVGHPRFVTDAEGHTTGFVYDERGLVLEENRPESAVTRHTYDLEGNLLSTLDPHLKLTRFTWDLRNRRETVELEVEPERFAAGRFTYDLNNRQLTVERPESGVQTLAYDDAGRLESVTATLLDQAGTMQTAVTTYTYDKNDNLRFIDDAEGRRTEFVYDPVNRRTDRIYPQAAGENQPAREQWSYDENGNIETFTDARGQVFDSTWDALNRERLRTYPAQDPAVLSDHLLSTAMAYDANGNLVRVDELFSQSGTLTTAQTFDDFDRLESVTDRWGQTITYGYDANGNRTSLQAPNQSTSYTFDGLNRLETVTTSGGLTRYTYHPNSRLKGIEYPNGTTATYTFDTANRLSTLEHNFGQLTIASYAYTYDDNGNRTSQTETQVGRDTEQTTYTYDLADRLSSVTYPDQAVVYTHDRAGNRLTESITPSTGDPYSKTYGYNTRDHLLTITHSQDPAENVTYTYDAGGNQRTKTKNGTVTTFIPNSRNQIARIEENTLPIGTYAYDYRGLRVEKYTDHRTRYLYDAQSVLQRHDDTQGTILYDYGPDRLLSVTHPSEGRSYYHHDALGSIISQSTETGSLLGQYSYDAWGHRRHEITNASNIFGFTGHETDTESGLIYAKARFYDPDTARFLSHDPVEGDLSEPLSIHRFLYVYSNPTNSVDPDGRRRRVIVPRPEDRAAQRIQARYEEAYRNFKKTPSGALAARRLEEDPSFTLTITFDPEYKQGLVVEDYVYDEESDRATQATLRVGSRFPERPIREDHYPFGAVLEREDEVGVYVVAHEEVGHFLKAVDDPEHNRAKKRVEDNPRRIETIKEAQRRKLIQEIEGSTMSERKKQRALRDVDLVVNMTSTQERRELQEESERVKKRVENVADEAGRRAVEEYRELED